MSANNSAVLLPDVMAKVAALGANASAAVHKLLVRLELAQLTEEVQDEDETLRETGKLEPDLIEAAILDHRT